MMHGFGFPLFMGGPLIWVIVVVGGYFLIRKLLSSKGSKNISYNNYPETEIYRLAVKHNGKITVSEVVTELGLEPKKAEKILESMTDGMRVRMDVDENGMVTYSFPELKKSSEQTTKAHHTTS